MSKIAFKGNASGTGTLTFEAPNTNTDRTINIPDEAGSVLTSASDLAAANLTGNVAAARITDALNAGGSAPIYACRAWVNFNGTGTVAIRESGNVSSITDNGTGTYVVNITNSLPDANGVANVTLIPGTAGTNNYNRYTNGAIIANNQVRVNTLSIDPTNSFNDTEFIGVSVFR